jgi:hypothetical protein
MPPKNSYKTGRKCANVFFPYLSSFKLIFLAIKKANTSRLSFTPSRMLWLAFAFLISLPALAQNTKGDKPGRQLPRITQKSKPSKTKKVRSVTKDISGRRLRTKNKSTAARAIESAPSPYKRNRSGGDKQARPIGGGVPNKIRSSSARAARNNVYPNRGPYVNNPSRKPRATQKAYSNRATLARAASLGSRRQPPPGRKGRVAPRSASRPFITRGKKNVYWGKFSKGEKAFTKDITGRPLRTKNFRTPSPGLIAQPDVYRGRKRVGDRPYRGTNKSGFATASKRVERAWRGDVSGNPIRKNSSKKRIETAGRKFYPRKLSISGKQSGAGRPLPGSGYQSRSGKGRNNKPLAVRIPAGGAGVASYSGTFKRSQLSPGLTRQGIGFTGNIKTRRPQSGGGSISGRSKSNRGNPIAVRIPSSGSARAGTYSGNLKASKIFNYRDQGEGFAGFSKARKPIKGGGSISGRSKSNRGNPIAVRIPSSGSARAGTYTGNLKASKIFNYRDQGEEFTGFSKARKPIKGGGSISGRSKSNRGNPIPVRIPPSGSARAGTYTGNLKASRIFNYRDQGEEFTGFLKARKPVKGGGSVSGKLWNNQEKPINVRTPLSRDAKGANYTGRIKRDYGYVRNPKANKNALKKKDPNDDVFAVDGLQVKVKRDYDYIQNPRAAKTSLKKKEPNDAAFAVAGLQVKVKRDSYIQNPRAAKASIKKKEPDDGSFAVAGLQIKVKQAKYEKKPHSRPGTLKGVGPQSATVKASEYQGRMKVIWDYKHNPSSAKAALNTIAPNRSFAKGNEFQGRARLTKNYRHNPKSNKDALKVIGPSRAYARINNYQGNLKMSKPHGSKLHPDAKFAHGHMDNVKSERTILTNVKLWWSKLFKKNDTQPTVVKEKIRRPRYDKKERDLWKDLYD